VDAAAVEDVYALSPTQQGMLFQILANPGAGMYLEQMVCALRGELEPEAFRRAWQMAVDRHPSLRAGFVWEGLSRPVQVVHRRAELLFQELDWRALAEDEQRERLEDLVREDRRRGFALDRPPLTRVTLVRLGPGLRHLIWTSSHLVIDAWCVSILLREVVTAYEALRQGRPLHLPPAPRYRDYVAWLKRQDFAAAEAFWRRTLAGHKAPTPIGAAEITVPAPGGEAEGGALERLRLGVAAETAAALEALARSRRITLHTLMLGAWAVLLAHSSGRRDVVFGAVYSGRPPELPGVEGMVGLFINTLPVRAEIVLEAVAIDWLQELQAAQTQAHRFEHTPPGMVQGWSEVPRTQPLFETILVFFNVVDFTAAGAASLEISYIRDVARSTYPLVVRLYPEPELILEMLYDPGRVREETVLLRLDQLRRVLAGIAADPGAPLGKLLEALGEEEKGRQEAGRQARRAAAGQRLRSVVPRTVKIPAAGES
jgi:hypothetical protein